jgi:TetR/AcrR family transcriptional regulator, mexJK operon transcriptional repressor
MESPSLADSPETPETEDIGRRGRKYDQVLEAARALFQEQGFGAVSTDAIAARASVSKSTVYAYFRSKEELFSACVRDFCSQQMAAFSEGFLLPDRPVESLTQLAQGVVGIILSPQAINTHRIIAAETTRFPELGQIYYDSGPKMLIAHIRGYLDAARATGSLKIEDVDHAAWHFIALIKTPFHDFMTLTQWPAPSPEILAVHIRKSVAVFYRAYAPTP